MSNPLNGSPADTNGSLPLARVRVIDLTQVVSGPVATMMMADFGAEVIKVEPPGGDSYRRAGRPLGDGPTAGNINFVRFSRGKKSVVLDLKTRESAAQLWRLLDSADVLVENFRPGVLSRLGFPWEQLHERCPRLIYTSISGYGHEDVLPSPFANRPAYAVIAEAAAGLTHLAGSQGGPPVWMGFAMADIFAGAMALSGTLLALRERDRTDVGRRVDIGMYDSAVLMNDLPIAYYAAFGEVMGRGRYSLQSPWGPYPATDGYFVVAVLTEDQWRAMTKVIDRADLANDKRLGSGRGRADHHDVIIEPAIRAWSQSLSRDYAVETLLVAGVPAAPVNTAEDVVNSPHTLARQMLITAHDSGAGPVTVVGNPIKIDGVPAPMDKRIPRLGEHTSSVFGSSFERAELRYTESEGPDAAHSTDC